MLSIKDNIGVELITYLFAGNEMKQYTRTVLDHGSVELKNIAGPIRRKDNPFDADSVDPAISARRSFGTSEKTREEDLSLVKYLINNKHTTPIEMIEVWMEMGLPIFVARQFVRHRTATINEISGRYVELPHKFYIPELKNIGIKPKSIKQGRTINNSKSQTIKSIISSRIAQHVFRCLLLCVCNISFYIYKFSIKIGIPNELARCLLPINIYTNWLWKQDLHNLFHFLSLRLDSHAQWESQQYAQAIVHLLRNSIPDIMDIKFGEQK